MSEETGKRIGDYEILGVLGSGGMGQVFKVRNMISDRIEAMKVLLPDLAGRQDLANRFLREIKVLAALNHPNIASLRTALTLGNQLVMVMEYVDGTTLAARLQQGPIPTADAVSYIDQVLNALSYAHRQNVIHRDIKPANMMLTPDGVIKLMDFGIARTSTDRALTSTGTTMGSLYYMPPEQVKGTATDARSDLYSVGVSLYEMVTGERPFRAESDYSLMAAQIQEQPKPPIELKSDLPPALNEIILIAMAKDPAQRFQTADAFRNAVSAVQRSLPQAAATQTARPSAAPLGATGLFQKSGSTMPVPPPVQSRVNMPAGSPELAPSVMDLSQKQGSHRGLYMALGALVVVAVLVAAGLYIPHLSKTRASEQSSTARQDQSSAAQQTQSDNGQSGQTNTPAQSTDQPTGATPDASTAPAANNSTSPDAAGASSNPPAASAGDETGSTPSAGSRKIPSKGKHTEGGGSGSAGSANSTAGGSAPTGGAPQDAGTSQAGAPQPQAADAAELEQLEQEMDQISSRAVSLNDSVDNLRRQQNAQGLGLRGDIASAQELMKANLAKAQFALQNQDAKNARKYLDLAQPQVDKLEKFLGH